MLKIGTFDLFTWHMTKATMCVVKKTNDASILENCRMTVTRPSMMLLSLLFVVCMSAHAQGTQSAKQAAEAAATRLQKAEALFQEHCKNAGEKITRTVDNVEGIFLMKIRPSKINYQDQFEMDDPYGKDLGGDGYILSFVKGSYDSMRPRSPKPGWPPRIGYLYVEAIDPQDGKRYRYTGSIKEVEHTSSILMGGDGKTKFKTKDFVLEKALSSAHQPRYGVVYDDISTHEDREYWIAGSSLRVIDLKTKEIIAERIGYMMDRGQGNTSGGRSPWLLAADNACPDFHRFTDPVVAERGFSAQIRQTQDFVEKVLKPKQGN